jgi:putative ABC transport system ATP-binding protein
LSTDLGKHLIEIKGPFMVDTRNLSKTYRLAEGQVRIDALKSVNIRIERGAFAVMIGPSGSGKTTFLNMVSGLDTPSKGDVFVGGLNITKGDRDFLNILRQETIGFIHQTWNLVPLLTALENTELPLEMAGVDPEDRHVRAQEVLERVGLGKRMHHRPIELSGGEQQRVGIARALVFDPPLILADEPTANLDAKTGLEIISLMKELQEEHNSTLLVSTHDPKITAEADLIIYLRDGAVVNEEIQMPDIKPAKIIRLKSDHALTDSMIKVLNRFVRNELIGQRLAPGDALEAVEMPFKVIETDPPGRVRIMRPTEVTIES